MLISFQWLWRKASEVDQKNRNPGKHLPAQGRIEIRIITLDRKQTQYCKSSQQWVFFRCSEVSAKQVLAQIKWLCKKEQNPPDIKNVKKLLNYKYLTTVTWCLAKVGTENAAHLNLVIHRRKSIDSAVFYWVLGRRANETQTQSSTSESFHDYEHYFVVF